MSTLTRKISVTKHHIEKGVPQDAWKSPISLAMNDAGFNRTSYFGAAFVDGVNGSRVKIAIPMKAQVVSSELCNHDIVAPFSFEVEYTKDCLMKDANDEEFEINL